MTALIDDFGTAEEALDSLLALRQEFHALAPDWTEAPEWAQWYAIDANGDSYWWGVEPSLSGGIWFARGCRCRSRRKS